MMDIKTCRETLSFRILVLLLTIVSIGTLYHFRSNACCDDKTRVYATNSGLGPDKWASIWLVHKYLNQGFRVPVLSKIPSNHNYELFDTPGSRFFRDTDQTSFAKLKSFYVRDNETLDRVASVIHDIEVNMWLPDRDARSKTIEMAYRDLQVKYDRHRVPYDCYMDFFDNVESYLSMPDIGKLYSDTVDLMPASSCGEKALVNSGQRRKLVPELSPDQVFDMIRSGRKVVFLDVREPEEFAEYHIPGAINLQIRNLNEAALSRLARSDLIVTYCVKDFRGFEMARLIDDSGVSKAAILNPYGIKGWIDSGLPVYRSGSISKQDAITSLQACIDRQLGCKFGI